jgi:hypothetical protein
MLGAAGAAVDYGRWQNARVATQSAMDAAVIAGTRALMENGGDADHALKVAADYYAKNVISRSDDVIDTISFQLNAEGTGVAATGNAELPTTFLSLLNISALSLVDASKAQGAAAEVGEASPGGDLEISLMLDVTGSMCDDGEGPCTSGSKLTALKAAARNLIDTVVWDDQSQYTSKVAIVPFSTRVRVGKNGAGGGIMKKVTDLNPTWSGYYKMCINGSGGGGSEDGITWTCNQYQTQNHSGWKIMPCVTDRFYDSGWKFDLTDTAPGTGKWLNAHDGSRMTLSRDSSNTVPTTETGTSSKPATHWNYTPQGACFDVAEANEIMPLSNSAAALKSRIDGLQAFGSTAGVLGTAWSWYTLSPNWKTVFDGNSEPKAYSLLSQTNETGAPKLRKIAILMSDGVYNTMRGWKGQDQQFMSDNAVAMCNAMKQKGIEIYTVGFALDNLMPAERDLAENTLRSCGSTIDHFYKSINVEQLQAAFKSIGAKVVKSSVRLTQ